MYNVLKNKCFEFTFRWGFVVNAQERKQGGWRSHKGKRLLWLYCGFHDNTVSMQHASNTPLPLARSTSVIQTRTLARLRFRFHMPHARMLTCSFICCWHLSPPHSSTNAVGLHMNYTWGTLNKDMSAIIQHNQKKCANSFFRLMQAKTSKDSRIWRTVSNCHENDAWCDLLIHCLSPNERAMEYTRRWIIEGATAKQIHEDGGKKKKRLKWKDWAMCFGNRTLRQKEGSASVRFQWKWTNNKTFEKLIAGERQWQIRSMLCAARAIR